MSALWHFPNHPPFANSRSLGFSRKGEGRSSGSDAFDPAGPRSASMGGSLGSERMAALRRASRGGFHRSLPPPAATARTCRPEDRCACVSPAHSSAGQRAWRPAADGADTSRPKLVLVRPTADAEAADVDDSDGVHYERVGVLDRPEPACLPEIGADLSAFRREQARRRCTVLLRCLWGVAISTGLIGIFPGMHLAWVFTGLFGLAALGLVGLMAYAKELEAEQQRRRARRVNRRGMARHLVSWSTPPSVPRWIPRRPATRGLGRRRLSTTSSRCREPQLAEHPRRRLQGRLQEGVAPARLS